VLITLGIVALVLIGLYLLRNFAAALLLIFAGILFGIFLNGLTNCVTQWLRLPRWAALTLICLLLGAALFLFGWFAGPQVVQQMQQLVQQLPNSVTALQRRLQDYSWGRTLLSTMPPLDQMHLSIQALLGPVTQMFTMTIEVLGWFVFIFFVGLYLAASPEEYLEPTLLVLSPEHRARGREVLHALGQGLGWWLFGRAVTMISLGILTAIALWLFDIPLALVLGIIAGLLLFVPYLGAIAAAIPAFLVALMQSPAKALWVLVIYTGVHVFEGYFITPFVQRRAVALPPGLLLSVQILSASLFGLGGVVFSTPLTVVTIILVQMLYVQDVLEEEVAVLGEHEPSEQET
jgi:predicted PurR-regulated permease PerM